MMKSSFTSRELTRMFTRGIDYAAPKTDEESKRNELLEHLRYRDATMFRIHPQGFFNCVLNPDSTFGGVGAATNFIKYCPARELSNTQIVITSSPFSNINDIAQAAATGFSLAHHKEGERELWNVYATHDRYGRCGREDKFVRFLLEHGAKVLYAPKHWKYECCLNRRLVTPLFTESDFELCEEKDGIREIHYVGNMRKYCAFEMCRKILSTRVEVPIGMVFEMLNKMIADCVVECDTEKLHSKNNWLGLEYLLGGTYKHRQLTWLSGSSTASRCQENPISILDAERVKRSFDWRRVVDNDEELSEKYEIVEDALAFGTCWHEYLDEHMLEAKRAIVKAADEIRDAAGEEGVGGVAMYRGVLFALAEQAGMYERGRALKRGVPREDLF